MEAQGDDVMQRNYSFASSDMQVCVSKFRGGGGELVEGNDLIPTRRVALRLALACQLCEAASIIEQYAQYNHFTFTDPNVGSIVFS